MSAVKPYVSNDLLMLYIFCPISRTCGIHFNFVYHQFNKMLKMGQCFE